MGCAGYQATRVDVVDIVATVTIDNPPINLFDLILCGDMRRVVGGHTAEL